MRYGTTPPQCPNGCTRPPQFVRTPDIIHYGKMVCPECGRWLDWVSKPQGGAETHPASELSISFRTYDPL